jgi:hypothetical protein
MAGFRISTPIRTSLWNDPDFQALGPHAQRLYVYLWTQSSVDNAGFIPLQVTKWARASQHLIPEDIEVALDELLALGWVMVDDDTEDLWLCRWIREDAMAVPNVYIGALRSIKGMASDTLRRAAFEEVRRIHPPPMKRDPSKPAAMYDDMMKRIDRTYTDLCAAMDNHETAKANTPSPSKAKQGIEMIPEPFGKVSERVPEWFRKGSERVLPKQDSDELLSFEARSSKFDGPCSRCGEGQRLGPEASSGENPNWCGDCNFVQVDLQRRAREEPC